MKNIYATLLAGSALLVSMTTEAQSSGSTRTKGQPMSFSVNNRFAQPLDNGLRGGGAPPNDLCTAVTASPVPVPGSIEFTGTTVNATNTGDTEAGSPLEQTGDTATVWHAFTTGACSNLRVEYCGTPTLPFTYWIALSLNCPAGATIDDFILASSLEGCADTNLVMVYEGLPAGTYYLPVYGEPGTAGPYTINLIAEACAAAPPNDECESAVPIAPGSFCNFSYYSSNGGTESLPSNECAGTQAGDANDDVWFSFVATAADMTLAAQGNEDGDGDEFTGYDVVLEVFEGTCAGPTVLGCADATLSGEAEELPLAGLSVGTTYWVRVFDWYSGYWDDNGFGICLVEGSSANIGIGENAISAFSLFPNPGTGVFNLLYSGANGLAHIEVLDVTGRNVYNKQAQVANGSTNNLDLTGLGAGNYNVRLTVGGVRTEQRLMVK